MLAGGMDALEIEPALQAVMAAARAAKARVIK
jgi:hypothetical protein